MLHLTFDEKCKRWICEHWFSKIHYYSFKLFFRFWLVKTTRIIQHNQLLHQIWKESSPYWINDVKSAARRKLLNRWRQNDVKSAPRCRLLNRWQRKPGDKVVLHLVSGKTKSVKCTPLQIIEPLTEKTWGQGCVTFGERKNKERNGETPVRRRKYFEWIIKQLLNLAFLGYEEFCRSRRVLSTSVFGLCG